MKILFFLLVIVAAPAVSAGQDLTKVDLWLPKKYEWQYSSLAKAAEIAMSSPSCFRLLNGRLHERLSTEDHLIFHFRCASEDGPSFFIQVDGRDFTVINSSQAQQLRAQKNGLDSTELEGLLAQKKVFWKVCKKAINERLAYFEKPKFVTEGMPSPEVEGKSMIFDVDFDALSQSYRELHFSISCTIESEESYKLAVAPRKSR